MPGAARPRSPADAPLARSRNVRLRGRSPALSATLNSRAVLVTAEIGSPRDDESSGVAGSYVYCCPAMKGAT